jgi:hypothetical protein
MTDEPKVIIDCPGETWCFGIPKRHVLTKKDADYNTATFEVELTVRESSVTLGGDYLFTVEFTRAHSNSQGWEDVSAWSKRT